MVRARSGGSLDPVDELALTESWFQARAGFQQALASKNSIHREADILALKIVWLCRGKVFERKSFGLKF